ncbi:hypothetical protein JCGZ_02841 [Jatropha curcas]|uniref:Uncharacterized protein n=1 Tax=Jatropha curcas TaxID=180498 RepID=A0A067LD07_JATCU|nr:hypothetical protein JCGZ_02841 [Jatropha curcas]
MDTGRGSRTLHEGDKVEVFEDEKEFKWESDAIEAMFKKDLETQSAERYSDFLYKKRSIGKKQRLSETGGEGVGLSRHTGGSISTTETTEKLAKKLNRQPTPMEVFTFTHTKDHDGVTFIDRHAELIRLYLEAAGGEKKRKVYKIGSQPDIFYSYTHGVSASRATPVEPDARIEEIQDLWAQLQAQQQQIS